MERRAFIASVAGLAAGGTAAGAAAGPASGVLVRSYLTALTSDAAWQTAAPAPGDRLRLTRAPERGFDPHSVAVHAPTGALLGYLPGTHARILAPMLEHGLTLDARVVALRQTPRRGMQLDVVLVS